jgi:predicted dehydrogenase
MRKIFQKEKSEMRFLIAGLGSMGKRRVRCLKTLGYTGIAGFDLREDRRRETEEKYSIPTFGDLDQALAAGKPDALIISVPPDAHHIYMKRAVAAGLPFFVEASVVDTDMELIKTQVQTRKLVGAPSATLLFHPAIQRIGETVRTGALGRISNILFHSGQYLPDWHTYEKVSDYYVSNPATGGAREIAPFELTWLTHLFGFPSRVCGNFRKTIDIAGAERIEDTYNFLLDYDRFLATVTIDVVSRYATRRLLINGEQKQLLWDWNLQQIQIYDPAQGRWEAIPYEMKSAAEGYNANIGENMYVDELNAFIGAVQVGAPFVNTLENDHKVLKLLYAVEEADRTSAYVRCEA